MRERSQRTLKRQQARDEDDSEEGTEDEVEDAGEASTPCMQFQHS